MGTEDRHERIETMSELQAGEQSYEEARVCTTADTRVTDQESYDTDDLPNTT